MAISHAERLRKAGKDTPAEVSQAVTPDCLLTRGANDPNSEALRSLYMALCHREGQPYIELKQYQEDRLDLEFYPVDSGMVLSRPALIELGSKYPHVTGCALEDSAFLQFDAGHLERFLRDFRGCLTTGDPEQWESPIDFPAPAPVLPPPVPQVA